jgi:hypothetical protein
MGRDRYTRESIQDEFRRDPQRGAISFDRVNSGFLTPVSNNRFGVVWFLDNDRQLAVVRAVVPVTNVNPQGDGLKEYIQRAVQVESKGAIAL